MFDLPAVSTPIKKLCIICDKECDDRTLAVNKSVCKPKERIAESICDVALVADDANLRVAGQYHKPV